MPVGSVPNRAQLVDRARGVLLLRDADGSPDALPYGLTPGCDAGQLDEADSFVRLGDRSSDETSRRGCENERFRDCSTAPSA